jgi:uncharacterized membrane protein YgcG
MRGIVSWVLALGLALVPSAARAEGLTKFTGYTRPGSPTGPEGPIKAVGLPPDQTPIGATVYFKVFELGDGDPADPWRTGFKNLEDFFVAGKAMRGRGSEKLDTTARYLYVYQVINDSGRDGQVKSAAVRLLVEPHLITSWGHFTQKMGEGVKGVGFSMYFVNTDPNNPKIKNMILPVSTAHSGVTDRVYRDPAPYFNAPKNYGLSNILIGNAPVPISDGEDTGREPERVVLQTMTNFEGAPNWLEKDHVQLPGLFPYTRLALPFSDLYNPYYNPSSPLTPVGYPADSMGQGAVRMTEALRRAPAVVAYWADAPLRPGQRGTLFGFTSNYPPVYENIRVRGNPLPAIQPAAGAPDVRPANLRADGEVPTPVAFEQAAPPTAGGGGGSLGSATGGISSGGSLLRGGGGFGGGGIGFPLGGLGGGLGGGTGGGTGNGTPGQQQPQAQTQTQPQQGNQTVELALNVEQAQAQQQAQAQAQEQHQRQRQNQQQRHGHVVPEPAAVVPALLAIPIVLLLVWRRRTVRTSAI